MSAALGKIESQLFAYVQMRRLQTVRTGELVRALVITPQQERELLSRLARRSLIARVRRGLYLDHHGCHRAESGAPASSWRWPR